MYVKLLPKDLNYGSYPSHLTNTYICGVTIECDGHVAYWSILESHVRPLKP